MKRKNTTRNALFTSIISLLLCVSMLVGTTFAWFTDEVVSGANTIKAGNLDIEVLYANAPDGTYKSIENENDLFVAPAGATKGLWEPGHTEVAYLKVVNNGTLALKYQFMVEAINEVIGKTEDNKDIKLSEILQFAATDPADTAPAAYTRETAQAAAAAADGNLLGYTTKTVTLAAGKAHYIALVVYMPESTGNEANYRGNAVPTINFKLTALATQVEAENDSFDNTYDEDAWNPDMVVTSAGELITAIEAIEDGDTVALAQDISFDTTSRAENGVGFYDGLNYIGDKSFTIDLNGHTITNENGTINDRLLRLENNGTKPNTITIKNGTLNAVGGLYSAIATAASNAQKLTINLENVEVNMGNTNGSGATIVVRGGAELNVKAGTVISAANAYCAIECAGGATANIYDGAEIYQNGTSSYCGSLVGVSGNGTVNVYGGYGKGVKGGFIAMTSGGTINVSGGEWIANTDGTYANGNNSVLIAQSQNGAKSTINVTGGTFLGGYNCYGDAAGDAQINISAGTFNADPTTYVAANYQAIENTDGTYTVLPTGMSAVSGYSHLYTDGTNYYVYDAAGLISMNKFWADNPYGNNMWGRSYNVMADIDATGYTWNSVWVNVGSNANDGFVLDGHGKTISGLKINGSMFTGTPNGGDAGTDPGKVKDLTFDNVTVVGDHWTAVVWGNTYGELVFENVHVLNSSITGKCNTAAFVGGTAQESGVVTIDFVNCSVKNTSISANGNFSGVKGDWASDPNGANVYLSRAFNDTEITFSGCVSENNTVTNTNGVVGGGIYGYTAFSNGWWAGIGTCDTFTNWSGIVAVAGNTQNDLANAIGTGASEVVLPAGEYVLPSSLQNGSEVTIVGSDGTVFDFTKVNNANNASVTFENIHFKGTNANVMNDFGIQSTTGHIVFKNCTFDGAVTNEHYGSVEYIGCTFTGTGYITTYAVKSAAFTGCVFDKADSRALLVYSHGDNPCVVTVTDCEFKAAAKAHTWNGVWTSAIEIDTTNIPTQGTSVTIDGCTYDANYSGLYRDKSAAGKANAVITVVE